MPYRALIVLPLALLGYCCLKYDFPGRSWVGNMLALALLLELPLIFLRFFADMVTRRTQGNPAGFRILMGIVYAGIALLATWGMPLPVMSATVLLLTLLRALPVLTISWVTPPSDNVENGWYAYLFCMLSFLGSCVFSVVFLNAVHMDQLADVFQLHSRFLTSMLFPLVASSAYFGALGLFDVWIWRRPERPVVTRSPVALDATASPDGREAGREHVEQACVILHRKSNGITVIFATIGMLVLVMAISQFIHANATRFVPDGDPTINFMQAIGVALFGIGILIAVWFARNYQLKQIDAVRRLYAETSPISCNVQVTGIADRTYTHVGMENVGLIQCPEQNRQFYVVFYPTEAFYRVQTGQCYPAQLYRDPAILAKTVLVQIDAETLLVGSSATL